MTQSLIVGYGNTLKGDHGLGPFIVGALKRGGLSTNIHGRMMCLPQLDISLVNELPKFDITIFVDARQDDDPALLRVERVLPDEALSQNASPAPSPHPIALPALLGMARQWYGKSPCSYLIQPKGFDFSIHETISEAAVRPAVMARLAIDQILWAHFADTFADQTDDSYVIDMPQSS